MIDISIDSKLKKALSNTALGLIQAKVNVAPTNAELWAEIEKTTNNLNKNHNLDNMFENPKIQAIRDAYKILGKEPSRYRSSIEALIRRTLQGKSLYKINNIVEINNLISMKSIFSVGVYDLSKIQSPIIFRSGLEGESYTKINEEVLNIENMPIFADPKGPFGSTTADSNRANIFPGTKEVLIVIISFSGQDGLEEYIRSTAELLKNYAHAEDIETNLIT